MKKLIINLALTILILLGTNLSAQSYYFATDVETKVVKLDEKGCELEIVRHDDIDDVEVFPIGTVLRGKFYEYNFRRRLMRDEYVKIHFYEAVLPSGTIQEIDNNIKVRPRVLVSGAHGLQLATAALATTLKVTIAVWSVGFPVGRGAKAVSDAAFAVYNTPSEESKLKQGAKGFVKGAFFPLPEIFMKGEEVALHNESHLWIQDADEDEKKLTAFVIKRKNQYLSRDKYYAAKGEEAPDYTQYLTEKNYRKYQKKLSKKGVSGKIKDVRVKENLVQAPKTEKKDLVASNEEDHVHVWQRSWRRPKVNFEHAQ